MDKTIRADRVDNSSKPKGTPWTRTQALSFIRDIRPEVNAAGFDVGLTGSLLEGERAHDLDIIVYPLNASRFDRDLLTPIFDEMSRVKFSPGRLKRAWESLGSSDSKHVEKRILPDGRLLDIFHLT